MLPIISRREDLAAFYRKLMVEPRGFQKFLEGYAQAFCNQLDFQWGHISEQTIYILCGTGLNGQYALHIAKELSRFSSKEIHIYVYNLDQRISEEIEVLVEELGSIESIKLNNCDLSKNLLLPDKIKVNDLVIDGLVGYEQESDCPPPFCRLFDEVNRLQGIKISIETPSGISLRANKSTPHSSIIQANYTYGIALPSLNMFSENYTEFFASGRVISVASYSFEDLPSSFYFIEDEELISPFRTKTKASSNTVKLLGTDISSYGHLLLTARASLYAGAGELRLYTNAEACLPIQMQEPELRLTPLDIASFIDEQRETKSTVALASKLASKADLMTLLKSFNTQDQSLIFGTKLSKDIILDGELIKEIPNQSILLLRDEDLAYHKDLIGQDTLSLTQSLAKRLQLNIILLSYKPFICLADGQVYLQVALPDSLKSQSNTEVLLGIVMALRDNLKEASILQILSLATYIYREACILAKQRVSKEILLSQDIIKHIPEVLTSFRD